MECIDYNQMCQVDTTCCGDMVCHRESVTDADGVCGPKRADGEVCHEDDNCLSDDCGDRTWSSMWTEGTCQPM